MGSPVPLHLVSRFSTIWETAGGCAEKVAERFQYIEKQLQPLTKYSTKPLKFLLFCSIMLETLDETKSCVLVIWGPRPKESQLLQRRYAHVTL